MKERDSLGRFVKGHNGIRNSGNFKIGHVAWNKNKNGIHLSQISEFKKGNIPWNKGIPWSKVIKLHKKIGASKGEHRSPETEIKKGQHLFFRTEFKSEIKKEKWKDLNYKINTLKKLAKFRCIRPTNPEKKFMKFCKDNNINFKYVGDGSFYIGYYNPDFIDEENKIVVEVFGDYWHNLPKVKELDNLKIKEYRDRGWISVIIWEHELEIN